MPDPEGSECTNRCRRRGNATQLLLEIPARDAEIAVSEQDLRRAKTPDGGALASLHI
jgi:hypothetical protein